MGHIWRIPNTFPALEILDFFFLLQSKKKAMGGAQAMKRIPRIKFPQRHSKHSGMGSVIFIWIYQYVGEILDLVDFFFF